MSEDSKVTIRVVNVEVKAEHAEATEIDETTQENEEMEEMVEMEETIEHEGEEVVEEETIDKKVIQEDIDVPETTEEKALEGPEENKAINRAEDLEEVVRVFATNVDRMSTERAARILTDALAGNADRSKVSTLAPVAPKGGEVYLIDLAILGDKKDALQDGFYWRHDGNKKYPKLLPGKTQPRRKKGGLLTLVKSIFKVKDSRVQRGFSNAFQRHMYRPAESEEYILIHYMGHEDNVQADALRGAKQSYIRKIKTVHVGNKRLPTSCVNCLYGMEDASAKHAIHVRLGRKLFAKNADLQTQKPQLSIMEAVEDVMEGVLSITQLKKYSNHLICHDCMLVLRQAINRKLEAEASLQNLHNRIDKITNLDRRKYYRENYATDKKGRCWGCMFEFLKSEEKDKMKYGRHSLSMSLISGMTVMEGIETMLEDEAESLFGLSPTRLFICKQCYQLMRMVVRAQCSFDNLQSNFTGRTHPKSVMAELQGIVANSDDDFSVAPPLLNDSDLDDIDEEAEFEGEGLGMEEEEGEELGMEEEEGEELSMEREELEEEEEELEDEGETDSEADVSFSTGRKRPGASSIGGSPEPKRAKEDGSESVDDNEVTVTTVDGGDDGSKKITVRLTAIKPKEEKGTAGASFVKLATPQKRGSSGPQIKRKMKTPRKVSSDKWELQFNGESAVHAGLVRLVLEVAGAQYTDCEEGNQDSQGGETSLPYPALPVIKRGEVEVSHVVVICRHLGEEYGLCPDAAADQLLADQIVQYCYDYLTEGRWVTSLEEGREYSLQNFIERIPMWLSFFEQCLKRNKDGKGFLFSNTISYADLALYHALQATEYKFPTVYADTDFTPLLKAYNTRLGSSDTIKRYHKSPQYKGVSSYLF